ncbi:hypothetical protein D3C73_1298120 [compost metagenome]
MKLFPGWIARGVLVRWGRLQRATWLRASAASLETRSISAVQASANGLPRSAFSAAAISVSFSTIIRSRAASWARRQARSRVRPLSKAARWRSMIAAI